MKETKQTMKIPFSPPDISEAEIAEVTDALRSGWITTGPKTKQLEKELATYCGVERAVCLNSATAALEMTLRLLGIQAGDEVIVPAYTYTATASPIAHVGATIVMVDLAKDSLEMDYEQLEAAISEKTKAIIPVDIAGILCDYDRLFALAEAKKALFQPRTEIQKAIGRCVIISDCAHGFGAIRDHKKAGAFADFTTFSFHAVKNLTTAEGGALTWKAINGFSDEAIYKQYQLLSLHGQTKDALSKNQLGSWEYDIVSPAYKCNMTDLQAALGLAQIKRYDGMLKRRHEIVDRYNQAFQSTNIQYLKHCDENHRSSAHLYITRIAGADEAKRNEIIIKMAERGVACNVHYKALPMLSAYRNMGFSIEDYPNAHDFYHNEITLPLYSTLSDEAQTYIIEQFLAVLEESRC